MFTAALVTISKIWIQPKCPSTDEWIKMWYIYTMGYSLGIKNNWNLLFAVTWMNLEDIMPSEMSDRDKYYMLSLKCEI